MVEKRKPLKNPEERGWSRDLLYKVFDEFYITPKRERKMIDGCGDSELRDALLFSREIGEATGAPLTMNRVEVYRDGSKALKRIIGDVRQAVKNVNIFAYSIAPDEVGERVADELIDLKARNPDLDTKVAVDKIGCFVVGCKDSFWSHTWDPATLKRVYADLNMNKYESLTIPGMLLTWIDAEKSYRMPREKREAFEEIIRDNLTPDLLTKMNPLFEKLVDGSVAIDIQDNGLNTDHSKVTSVDGKIVYLGGRNFGNDYFGPDSWSDHTFRVEGPVAALCESEWFGTDLNQYFKYTKHDNLSPVRLLINKRSTSLTPVEDVIEDYPDPHEKQLTYAIYRSLENAKKSIYIEHSYLSDKGIIKRLRDAAKRQVNIKVVRPEPEDVNIGVSNYRTYEQLGDLPQVEMLDVPYISHAKVVNVDGMHTIVGSANFIKSSLHVHGEVGLMFSGNSAIQRHMNAMCENTTEIARRTTGIRHKIVGGILRPALYGSIHRAIKGARKML